MFMSWGEVVDPPLVELKLKRDLLGGFGSMSPMLGSGMRISVIFLTKINKEHKI